MPALVVLALVAVVAIAATGSTPSGTSGVRPPSAALLDTILSLGFVAVLAVAGLLAYGLTQQNAIRGEIASGRYPRTPLRAFLLFMSLLRVVTHVRGDAGAGLRHPVAVAALGVATLLAGSALLALADSLRASGLAVDLLGAAAAAGALLLVALVALRSHERPPR